MEEDGERLIELDGLLEGLSETEDEGLKEMLLEGLADGLKEGDALGDERGIVNFFFKTSGLNGCILPRRAISVCT